MQCMGLARARMNNCPSSSNQVGDDPKHRGTLNPRLAIPRPVVMRLDTQTVVPEEPTKSAAKRSALTLR